jgi:hypothetical protein
MQRKVTISFYSKYGDEECFPWLVDRKGYEVQEVETDSFDVPSHG